MERQLQRQQHLTAACKRLGLDQAPNFKTSDMYINDTLKYLYCVVNKVNGSSANCFAYSFVHYTLIKYETIRYKVYNNTE